MKEKEIYNITYPRIVYSEKQNDLKGLLLVGSVMGGAYLLFIAAISLKLGFM